MNGKYIIALSLLLIISCSKEKQNDGKFQDGVYKGTFKRELVWADNNTANITLTFTSNQWSGSSDMVKYPALCHGTYSIIGDTINFENECVWTAEFDWSLILSGKYVLTERGNTIEFQRDYRSATSDTYIDKYKIIKKER